MDVILDTKVICDLDGTLSRYPGSDFRSLYTKFEEFSRKNDDDTAGKLAAENAVNRLTAAEIKQAQDNLKYLYDKYGILLILSLNYKIVVIKYLQELQVEHLFDFTISKFREDLSEVPRKENVWVDFIKEYKQVIYIEDDISIIKSLEKVHSSNVKFIHMKEWFGVVDIKLML